MAPMLFDVKETGTLLGQGFMDTLGLEKGKLFNLAGYLPIKQTKTDDLRKHKSLAELDILVDRVTVDIKRIIRELYMKF